MCLRKMQEVRCDILVLSFGCGVRPWELDDAVRRRLVKRIYVPLPDVDARLALLRHTLDGQPARLRDVDLERIAQIAEGWGVRCSLQPQSTKPSSQTHGTVHFAGHVCMMPGTGMPWGM